MNLQWTYRKARRLVVTLIGGTVLVLGIALLVLPGPGTVVIVVGLAILATEWVWARRLLKRLKKEGQAASRTLGGLLGRRRRGEGVRDSGGRENGGEPGRNATSPGNR